MHNKYCIIQINFSKKTTTESDQIKHQVYPRLAVIDVADVLIDVTLERSISDGSFEVHCATRSFEFARVIHHSSRNPKVENVDRVTLISFSTSVVRRLQITMNEVMLVELLDRFQTLHRDTKAGC